MFRSGAKVLLAGALVSVAATAVFAAIAYSMSLSYNTALLTLSIPGEFIQDAA
jgi:ABC-type multidrug transport system permease subunit